MLIYYAHPIDQRTIENEGLPLMITSRGGAIYDPGQAWIVSMAARPKPGLQRANLAVLRNCDGILVHLHPDVMSIGTTLELVEAANHGIPALVFGRLRSSWALSYLGIEQTDDVDEVARWLEGIG